MALVHPSARPATVDIAGSAWPMFKLEALALGLLTCLVLALITGSPQVAVLVAAGAGAARWVVGLAGARRRSPQRADRMLIAR